MFSFIDIVILMTQYSKYRQVDQKLYRLTIMKHFN